MERKKSTLPTLKKDFRKDFFGKDAAPQRSVGEMRNYVDLHMAICRSNIKCDEVISIFVMMYLKCDD